jgi:hypothetical protein
VLDFHLGHHDFVAVPLMVTRLPPDLPLLLGVDFADHYGLNISWRKQTIWFEPLRVSTTTIIDPPDNYGPTWPEEMDYETPSLAEARTIVPPEYPSYLDVFQKNEESLVQNIANTTSPSTLNAILFPLSKEFSD